MKYVNRNNQVIEVSTTELHFDELNTFPIEVITEVINYWMPALTVAKAIKYADWQSVLNLFHYTQCLDQAFFNEIPPFELLECTPKESVLAQNIILKKLRQVQAVQLSKGNKDVKSKYVEEPSQISKLMLYPNEFLRDALTLLPECDRETLAPFIIRSKSGDKCPLLLPFEEEPNSTKVQQALDNLVDKLERYLREPHHIGFEPVNRSNQAIIEYKFSQLVGCHQELLDVCCQELPKNKLAKVLLPLEKQMREALYGFLSPELATAIKEELQKRESETFEKWQQRFKNKTKNEIKTFLDRTSEHAFLVAYKPLCLLEKIVQKKSESPEPTAEAIEVIEQPPYCFEQLENRSQDCIRYMVRNSTPSELLTAFYYSKDTLTLEPLFDVFPSMKRRFELEYADFEQPTVDQSLSAQLKLGTLLDSFSVSGTDGQDSVNKADENVEAPTFTEEQESELQTIAIFDKNELEETATLRELTGEYGAELANEVLKKGPEKKIVLATESMLDELDLMKEQFPNFEAVIEELYICLKVSLLNASAIEFPVINLQSVPGCGKTEFVRTLAKRLKLEFFDLSIATCHSKADLIGGSSQFKSSTMGAVGKGVLLKTDTFNPIMFLDELCLAKSDGEWAITPSLLSLFDAEQRKNVKEQFLDLNFDCSGVLFFTTTNNYENLLPALKSRLTNFDIKPPSKMEMKKICQNIYTSYLKEKKFQRHFEQQLSFDVTESLSLLTPREAKNTLISAIRKAFVRSADCSELGQVTLQDIAVRKGSDCEPQPVGFIH